jgi:branched-chain amino acid transport system ATP-binding protein
MTALLNVRGLCAFYGPLQVLHGLDFSLVKGGVTCLLGANGAGKTTTLRALSGMVRIGGAIEFEGASIGGRATEDIVRLGIAHVPEGRGTFSRMSVEENLQLGAMTRSGQAAIAADIERVYAYFPRLAERRAQQAGTLSGGEQQMLAIGRALMNRPTLLLLDEPSLGLSPILVKEIFTIIKRVNEEQGMSILLVEQNAKVALETAHYGYVLEIGRVVMNDTCERLMNSKDIQEFYLGAKEEGARGERRWKKKKTWR